MAFASPWNVHVASLWVDERHIRLLLRRQLTVFLLRSNLSRLFPYMTRASSGRSMWPSSTGALREINSVSGRSFGPRNGPLHVIVGASQRILGSMAFSAHSDKDDSS